MKKALKVAVATLLLGVASFASAQKAHPPIALGHDALIQGLGERFPNAKDVSKSTNFHVYEFKKDGLKYVQINRLDGTVLTAIAFAGNTSFVMPVGELTTSQVVFTGGNQAQAITTAAAGACPCSAQVVYDDAYARIVVVYGSNGQVIQVITIQKTNKAT